jgi:hypothetical protein
VRRIVSRRQECEFFLQNVAAAQGGEATSDSIHFSAARTAVAVNGEGAEGRLERRKFNRLVASGPTNASDLLKGAPAISGTDAASCAARHM